MTTTYSPKLIEKVAWALFDHEWRGIDRRPSFEDDAPPYWKEKALAALNASPLGEVVEALKGVDHYLLVIESSVRFAERGDAARKVLDALKAARAALRSVEEG